MYHVIVTVKHKVPERLIAFLSTGIWPPADDLREEQVAVEADMTKEWHSASEEEKQDLREAAEALYSGTREAVLATFATSVNAVTACEIIRRDFAERMPRHELIDVRVTRTFDVQDN
jgi:hypothetical protein